MGQDYAQLAKGLGFAEAALEDKPLFLTVKPSHVHGVKQVGYVRPAKVAVLKSMIPKEVTNDERNYRSNLAIALVSSSLGGCNR